MGRLRGGVAWFRGRGIACIGNLGLEATPDEDPTVEPKGGFCPIKGPTL